MPTEFCQFPNLDSNLVVSGLGDVTDPSVGVVTRFIIDTQKSYMHSTCSEHGYLEFCVDRRSAPRLRSDGWHQINFCLNVTLGLSREALHTPYDSLLLWFVLGATERILDLGLCGILGYRDLDHDMSSEKLIRKVCNNLKID
jgi:hypothetical protein